MGKMVIGRFDSQDTADVAVDKLMDHGYTSDQISFLVKENKKVVEKTLPASQKVADSAATGAVSGGLVGGLTGLLVGVGALTIPGIGALFIGGPLAAALGLTGAAATAVSAATSGVVAGGLVGGLVGLGMPEQVAREYEESVKDGGVVLAVPVDDDRGQTNEVTDIFTTNGANQVKTI